MSDDTIRSAVHIGRVKPNSNAARWCLEHYYAELDQRFEDGFDLAHTVTADEYELVPPRGIFLVALLDGRAVGCGCLKTLEPGIAHLKRMWVAPRARGTGLGRRLLKELEGQALKLGFETVRLETNRVLSEAQALYRSAGYHEIEPFIAEPYGDFWFEKRLA